MNRPAEIELELFTHRFAAIAAEMGEMLRRTALSTNVRERLDFSCALLDADGRLVVNAPHIPVHLGALGLCVRRVREAIDLGPGDTIVTNHPGWGGSHLPDVTLVTPVFDAAGERLLGHVASRAHHSEIGGTRPGSMPPDARRLVEEGVVLAPTHLVRGGESRRDEIRALLERARHPSRAVEENLADLDAALAANQRGASALRALVAEHGGEEEGAEVVARHMDDLRALATSKLRTALGRREPGTFRAVERLDDGTPLAVAVTLEHDEKGGRAIIDFTGSGDVHPGNLNATPAIVRSVVLYVLRLLVGEERSEADGAIGEPIDLPLNEGLLEPVELIVPEGILSPPFGDDPAEAPAVVGGNVETSQRLVDALVRALGLLSGGQGTMNNVLFGNESFGYYETVCGGAGAGPGFAGASSVHTHMTNTRITDPEILEHRYPVRLERFTIRRGSGGAGRHRGGDGVVRELRFLEPVQLSILSQHRVESPFALEGGEPGARGRQWIVRADGREEALEGIDRADLDAGDRLVLETPGGGGWGSPTDRQRAVR